MAQAVDHDAQTVAPPGAGLQAFALAELDAAMAHLGWRGGRLHAGVHLARKGVRRTRATLALAPERLGPTAAQIDRDLRRLNRALSSLRDLQALVETLDRLIDAERERPAAALLRRARRVAAARRAAATGTFLADDPALATRRAQLGRVRAALQALPWERVRPDDVAAALRHSLARLSAARARAFATADNEDWHRWRRRARRLSQQRRALLAIGWDGIERLPFDRHTTERLGAAQDLALLLEHCGKGSPFSKPDRTALRAFAAPELARAREKIAAGEGIAVQAPPC